MLFYTAAVAFAGLITSVLAQTYTDCDPLNATCPADPALGTTLSQNFSTINSLSSAYWKVVGDPEPTFETDGAHFIINSRGEAPTIQTPFYMFFGRLEVIMKAASGQGIISSIVLLSDDLDEIDWEIMGGNTSFVESNYYGKGNTSQANAIYHPCDNPQGGFHNYTTVWGSDKIEWHLDGNVVRTVEYGDAVDLSGKTMFPQTPSFVKIGNWAGGDPSLAEGTIAWAGGPTDFTKGPFDMVIQSVTMVDAHTNVSTYTWPSGTDGSWQNIQIADGLSSVNKKIHTPPQPSVSERFNALSPGAKIGVGIGILVVVAIAFLALLYCCIHQRRAGRNEKKMADAEWDKEQLELNQYRNMMTSGGFAKSGSVHVSEQPIMQQGRMYSY